MRPFLPTTTARDGEAATLDSPAVVSVVSGVHVVPFADTYTMPLDETAMNWLPVQATSVKFGPPTIERFVQELPVGEVTIVPDVPTAANREPFHATACRAAGAAAA